MTENTHLWLHSTDKQASFQQACGSLVASIMTNIQNQLKFYKYVVHSFKNIVHYMNGLCNACFLWSLE
jgi:hypothetical protein